MGSVREERAEGKGRGKGRRERAEGKGGGRGQRERAEGKGPWGGQRAPYSPALPLCPGSSANLCSTDTNDILRSQSGSLRHPDVLLGPP